MIGNWIILYEWFWDTNLSGHGFLKLSVGLEIHNQENNWMWHSTNSVNFMECSSQQSLLILHYVKASIFRVFLARSFRHLGWIWRFTREKLRNNTERIRRKNTGRYRPETYWVEPLSHKRIWNTNKHLRCSILQKTSSSFQLFSQKVHLKCLAGS